MSDEIIDVKINLEADASDSLESMQSVQAKIEEISAQVAEFKTGFDSPIPMFADQMNERFRLMEESLARVEALRTRAESVESAVQRNKAETAFANEYRRLDTVVSDLRTSINESEALGRALGAELGQQFTSGIHQFMPQIVTGLKSTALNIARTTGTTTDSELVNVFKHSDVYRSVYGQLNAANPNAFTDQNMTRMLTAILPFAAPQYTRNKYIGWERVQEEASNIRDLLPSAFAKVPLSDSVQRHFQQGTRPLNEEEITAAHRIIRENPYMASEFERAGLLKRSNGMAYFNPHATTEHINALGGFVAELFGIGMRGRESAGIDNIEDPKFFRKLKYKNNLPVSNSRAVAEELAAAFPWINPEHIDQIPDTPFTRRSWQTLGTFAARPRKTTAEFREFTLDNIVDGKIVEREGEEKNYLPVDSSLYQRRLANTPGADPFVHNRINSNEIYVRLPVDLFQDPDANPETIEAAQKKMIEASGMEQVMPDGTRYKFSGYTNNHMVFTRSDIKDAIEATEEGKNFFYNGEDRRVFSDFESFGKAMDARKKSRTEGEDIRDLYGTDLRGVKVVVADMKELTRMDGQNIISDRLVPESFQGRDYGGKSTYQKVNVRGLFEAYPQLIDGNGNIVLPGVGFNGGDLVIPSDVDLIEDVGNIKTRHRLEGMTQEEVNALRSAEIEREGIFAKTTADRMATDTRYISAQAASTMTIGPEARNYFNRIFLHELASLEDAGAVKSLLFSGDDYLSRQVQQDEGFLASEEAQKRIADYRANLFARAGKGDILLPQGVANYAMLSAWLPDVFNRFVPEDQLTDEQKAASLGGDVAYLMSKSKELGIFRNPATASGNLLLNNKGSEEAFTTMAKMLGVDETALYVDPKATILEKLQGADLDGDTAFVAALKRVIRKGESSTDEESQQESEFGKILRSILIDTAESVKRLHGVSKRTKDDQEAVNAAHTKPVATEQTEYSIDSPEDQANHFIASQKAAMRMGAADAVSRNARQLPISKGVARAILDSEAHYDIDSNGLAKKGREWETTQDEWTILKEGSPFMQILNWASKSRSSMYEEAEDGGPPRVKFDQEAFNKRKIDATNFASINQGSALAAMYERYIAKQNGYDISDGFDWDKIFDNLPAVDDSTAAGKLTKRLREVKLQQIKGEFLAFDDSLVEELTALAGNASKEIEAQVIKEYAGKTQNEINGEIDRRKKAAGVNVVKHLKEYGLTRDNIRKRPELRADIASIENYIGGSVFGYGQEYAYNTNEPDPIIEKKANAEEKKTASKEADEKFEQAVTQEDIWSNLSEAARKEVAELINERKTITQRTQDGSYDDFAGDTVRLEYIDQRLGEIFSGSQSHPSVIAAARTSREARNQYIEADRVAKTAYDEIRSQEEYQGVIDRAIQFSSELWSSVNSKDAKINDTSKAELYYNQKHGIARSHINALERLTRTINDPDQLEQISKLQGKISENVDLDYAAKSLLNASTLKEDLTQKLDKMTGAYDPRKVELDEYTERLQDARKYAEILLKIANEKGVDTDLGKSMMEKYNRTQEEIKAAEEQLTKYRGLTIGKDQFDKEQEQATYQYQQETLARNREATLAAYRERNESRRTGKPVGQYAKQKRDFDAQIAQEEERLRQQQAVADDPAATEEKKARAAKEATATKQYIQDLKAQQSETLRTDAVADIKDLTKQLTERASTRNTDSAVSGYIKQFDALQQSISGALERYEELRKIVESGKATDADKKAYSEAYDAKKNLDQAAENERAYLRDATQKSLERRFGDLQHLASGKEYTPEEIAARKTIDFTQQLEQFRNSVNAASQKGLIGSDMAAKMIEDSNAIHPEDYEAEVLRQEKLNAELRSAQDRQRTERLYNRTRRLVRDPFGARNNGMLTRAIYRRDNAVDQLNNNAAAMRVDISKKETDLSKLDPGTEKYAELNKELEQAKSNLKETEDAAKSLSGAGGTAAAAFVGFGETLERVAKQFGRQLFHKAIQEVKQFMTEYSAAMTEIQMITLKTDAEMQTLGDSLIQTALDMKVSVSDVTSSAANLYRQGLDDADVQTRMEDVLKFAKVANIKTEEASKIITTALSNNLVSSSEEAMDALVALGDSAATTASEIAKGMQKSAASAKEAGVSYEQLVTMLTIITSKTQLGGSTAGTALQTLMYRLYRIGSGEDIYDENGNRIFESDVTKALGKAGVSIFDSNGSFRGAYDIMIDLAKQWDTMGDTDQGRILDLLGAGRQRSNIATLIQGLAEDNGELADKYLNLAANSEGITDDKYEVYLKSLAAATEELNTSIDQLIASLANVGVATGFLDFLSSIVQGMTAANEATGGFSTVLVGFVPLLAGLGVAIAGAFSPIAAAISPVLVAMTAFAGIAAIIGGIGNATKSDQTDSITKISQDVNIISNNKADIDSMIDRMEVLNNTTNRTTEEERELASIAQTLSTVLGLTGSSAKDAADSFDYYAQMIDEARKAAENYSASTVKRSFENNIGNMAEELSGKISSPDQIPTGDLGKQAKTIATNLIPNLGIFTGTTLGTGFSADDSLIDFVNNLDYDIVKWMYDSEWFNNILSKYMASDYIQSPEDLVSFIGGGMQSSKVQSYLLDESTLLSMANQNYKYTDTRDLYKQMQADIWTNFANMVMQSPTDIQKANEDSASEYLKNTVISLLGASDLSDDEIIQFADWFAEENKALVTNDSQNNARILSNLSDIIFTEQGTFDYDAIQNTTKRNEPLYSVVIPGQEPITGLTYIEAQQIADSYTKQQGATTYYDLSGTNFKNFLENNLGVPQLPMQQAAVIRDTSNAAESSNQTSVGTFFDALDDSFADYETNNRSKIQVDNLIKSLFDQKILNFDDFLTAINNDALPGLNNVLKSNPEFAKELNKYVVTDENGNRTLASDIPPEAFSSFIAMLAGYSDSYTSLSNMSEREQASLIQTNFNKFLEGTKLTELDTSGMQKLFGDTLFSELQSADLSGEELDQFLIEYLNQVIGNNMYGISGLTEGQQAGYQLDLLDMIQNGTVMNLPESLRSLYAGSNEDLSTLTAVVSALSSNESIDFEGLIANGATLDSILSGDGIDPSVYETICDIMDQLGLSIDGVRSKIKGLTKDLASNAVRTMQKYGARTEDVADNMDEWGETIEDQANKIKNVNAELTEILNNKYYRDQYRAGNRSSETKSKISEMTGIDENQLEKQEEYVKRLLDLADMADMESIQSELDAFGEKLVIPGLQIDASSTDIQGLISTLAAQGDSVAAALQDYVAYLVSMGAEVRYDTVNDGDSVRVVPIITKMPSGFRGGGGGGGGGGSKKSAAEKLLENQDHEQKMREHIIKMIQYEETRYENAGELTNYGIMLQHEIDEEKRQVKAREENVAALKKQLAATEAASDDWYSLRDAIMEAEEAMAEMNNTIKENEKKLKENQQAILKLHTDLEQEVKQEIETRIQAEKDVLSGTVSMQDTILEAIRNRYEKEWELMQKDIDKKKDALQEEISLIDERLQKRKDAEDEAEKYDQLAEYKRQLALISMDSTRTRDQADLREKIADLEKEIAWDVAEDQAKAQKEGLQDQIDAYDDYVEDYQEYLDDLLENANNFADEVDSVMRMSHEEMIQWLEQNVEDYANSLDASKEQMVQNWDDMFKQMKGIIDTFWEEIAKTLSSKDSFLEYMKQSTSYLNASEDEQKQMLYTWETMYDDYLSASKVSQEAVDYTHSDDYASGSVTTATTTKTPSTPPSTKQNPTSTYTPQTYLSTPDGTYIPKPSVLKTTVTMLKYASGGLVDYTGPAWVDGTKSKPEAFLSADDTSMIRSMLDMWKYVAKRPTITNLDSLLNDHGESTVIGDVYVTLNEAQFNTDEDYEQVAKKVGEAFTKELARSGMMTASYAF